MRESIDERRTAPAATEAWVAALSGVHFVSWIAKEFAQSGVAREDLEAEGRLGLFDAALRFDASRGVQFLTYAAWWARRRMQTFVARHAAVVRRPGSRPLHRRLLKDVSLDDVVCPGSTHRWRDVLADGGASQPLDTLLVDENVAVVSALADELPPLWKAILVSRYGLDGEPPMTLAAIGEIHGLSRERVRQIEAKCLRRMRRRLEAWGARHQVVDRSPREMTTAAAKSPLTLSVVRHMSRKRSTPSMMPIPSGGTPTMPRISAITGSEPAGTPAVPMPPRTQMPTTSNWRARPSSTP
jgi:RNA polymerase sigma factor (sigma-70 family)